MNTRMICAVGTALGLGALAGPAMATSYSVAGTFQTLTGGYYETLSGGSFAGTFELADGSLPAAPGTSDYLYDVPFSIDIFNASGVKVTTLQNTASADTYLQVANTYLDIYGGLRLFFRVSNTDYLQLVMPLGFNGNGSIAPVQSNYALVLGDDYAYLDSGTVASVPEPASWALMLLGMGTVGVAVRCRRRGMALA